MKTYAHFDQSGAFVRFFQADPASLPTIPLADDGLPRTVEMEPEPDAVSGKKFTPTRSGAWLESEADPAPVPSVLPAWRVRAVLRRRGLMDSVEAMIAALPEPTRVVVEEQMKSSNFERHHYIIEQFGAVLGLSSDDLDDIFREGDAIV